MFQGNWKCSKCGGAITELPFQPRSEAGLTCRSCFMGSKGGGAPASASEENPAADSMNTPEPDLSGAPEVSDVPDFDPFAGGDMGEQDAVPMPDELNEQLPEEAIRTGEFKIMHRSRCWKTMKFRGY